MAHWQIVGRETANTVNDGRLFVKDILLKHNAGVVNDLPRLWFFGCVVKGVVTFFRYARISAVSIAAR
jgi:hypothetical protein